MSRRERIWDKVMARVRVHPSEPGQEEGCWEWLGPDSGTGRGGGYPRMCLEGATMAVHKVMWVIRNGPIPPRKQLDHICTRRRCVNPAHLELTTHKENCRRRDERRRLAA